jgi:hypothetical protein
MWYERIHPRRWYHTLWPWKYIIALTNHINTITDKDLNELRRPLAQYWKMEWMKKDTEVRILHAALRRKAVVISNMKRKINEKDKS